MLKFYESFGKYNVPKVLRSEVFDTNGKELELISNLSKVNIFIGPNNSGKSKFLRELLREESVVYYGNDNWSKIKEIIDSIFAVVYENLAEIFPQNHNFIIKNSGNGEVINTENLENLKQELLKYIPDYNIWDSIEKLKIQFIQLPSGIIRNTSYNIREKNSNDIEINQQKVELLLNRLDQIKEFTTNALQELIKFQISSYSKNPAKIYIPSIRTLRPFGATADLKKQTTMEYDYQNVQILNGQEIPEYVHELTTSPFFERKRLLEFEKMLSKFFFDSKEVKLTYGKKKNVLLIKIGQEMERPIYELGDGLQMIIILTFPFFINDSGVVVIEEPELFLHPGLQKTFLRFLVSDEVILNFQIFLATHSNHIIDSINQSDLISLYSIQKKQKKVDNELEKIPDFIIENLTFGNENFLKQLGITNTSVYLSNCTIWVEGITDRLYIQKFLNEYLKSVDNHSKYFVCKSFKEGVNYSFALTGGDSIIHWDFSDENEYSENAKKIIVRKFCSRSFVIVDNDFGKNLHRKKMLQEVLNDRFVELDNPEIENLLSQNVIDKTLLTYPSVKSAVLDAKLPSVKREVFKRKKIGYIIDNIILNDYSKIKKFSSGNLSKSSLKSGDKFIFCEKALEFITSENLTEESKKLVEKILDFVIEKNLTFN